MDRIFTDENHSIILIKFSASTLPIQISTFTLVKIHVRTDGSNVQNL